MYVPLNTYTIMLLSCVSCLYYAVTTTQPNVTHNTSHRALETGTQEQNSNRNPSESQDASTSVAALKMYIVNALCCSMALKWLFT